MRDLVQDTEEMTKYQLYVNACLTLEREFWESAFLNALNNSSMIPLSPSIIADNAVKEWKKRFKTMTEEQFNKKYGVIKDARNISE